MPSVTRRTDSTPARRATVEAELMRAAEELLGEGHCYTELSIEQIAARAGISRSAFYFYFQDKRELLIRMVERVAEHFYAVADRWWKLIDEGGIEEAGPTELKNTLSTVLGVWREHAPLLGATVETSGYDKEVFAFWRGVMERFVEATREHIEAQQAVGKAKPLPADATAFTLVWMTERVWYQHIVGSSEVSDEDLIDALTGVIWSVVASDGELEQKT